MFKVKPYTVLRWDEAYRFACAAISLLSLPLKAVDLSLKQGKLHRKWALNRRIYPPSGECEPMYVIYHKKYRGEAVVIARRVDFRGEYAALFRRHRALAKYYNRGQMRLTECGNATAAVLVATLLAISISPEAEMFDLHVRIGASKDNSDTTLKIILERWVRKEFVPALELAIVRRGKWAINRDSLREFLRKIQSAAAYYLL